MKKEVKQVEMSLGEVLALAARKSQGDRIDLYNAVVRSAYDKLLHDLPQDPALCPQLIEAGKVVGNDYNPNQVASPELDLLEQSMEADGITMCIVTIADGTNRVVVDGFHRRTVGAERLGRKYLPCSLIDKPLADRMASTVRHNRARGKHQVELMGDLVKSMIGLGWTDQQIARAMGMSEEEVLRLRQVVGAAAVLAAQEYSREWATDDRPDD